MDDEAVAVAVDVGGRVGLELDGDVGGGGVELEASFGSSVLTQNFSCEVVSIVKGHHVVLPDVQPETRTITLSVFSFGFVVFFFSMNTNQLDVNVPPPLIFKLSLTANGRVRMFYSCGVDDN